jgi:hypothetical protein
VDPTPLWGMDSNGLKDLRFSLLFVKGYQNEQDPLSGNIMNQFYFYQMNSVILRTSPGTFPAHAAPTHVRMGWLCVTESRMQKEDGSIALSSQMFSHLEKDRYLG